MLVTNKEGKQVPARAIRPVRVLHHHSHRAPLRQPLKQGKELLEQPRAGLDGHPAASR